MEVQLEDLLKELCRLQGSDLHLTVAAPPQVRVDGSLQALDGHGVLTAEQTRALAYQALGERGRIKQFEACGEMDFSFGLKTIARFRANVFLQRGAVAAAFRAIPFSVSSYDELGLPGLVRQLCRLPHGLVLVTGPSGVGKSTTLAAMIDQVNTERHGHIVTLEDPIEFLHRHKNCLVNQREVGSDTRDFSSGLRNLLREDPDVALIAEMRDLESIETALRVAETGHLTFSTVHTNSAIATVNRIIDVFPGDRQQQIRAQLAAVLQGVLCQALLPNASGRGRVLAVEALLPDSAVRNLIREEKTPQIYTHMQAGQEKTRMRTMNQSLAQLAAEHKITVPVALQHSPDQDELRELLARAGVDAPATRRVVCLTRSL